MEGQVCGSVQSVPEAGFGGGPSQSQGRGPSRPQATGRVPAAVPAAKHAPTALRGVFLTFWPSVLCACPRLSSEDTGMQTGLLLRTCLLASCPVSPLLLRRLGEVSLPPKARMTLFTVKFRSRRRTWIVTDGPVAPSIRDELQEFPRLAVTSWAGRNSGICLQECAAWRHQAQECLRGAHALSSRTF